MVYTSVCDLDYRSDECDEQTANELYIDAFFGRFGSDRKQSRSALDLITPISSNGENDGTPSTTGGVINSKQSLKRKSAPAKLSRPPTLATKRAPQINAEGTGSARVRGVKQNRKALNRVKVQHVQDELEDEDEGISAKYGKHTKKQRLAKNLASKKCMNGADLAKTDTNSQLSKLNSTTVRSRNIERSASSLTYQQLIQDSDDESTDSARVPPLSGPVLSRMSRYYGPSAPTAHSTLGGTKRPYQDLNAQDPWTIIDEDRYALSTMTKRFRFMSELECSNCRQPGHTKFRCTQPTRNICFCCGEYHRATRCKRLVCSVCKLAGHLSEQCPLSEQLRNTRCRECNNLGHGRHAQLGSGCPDLWRRYHQTTTAGPPVVPNRQITLPANRIFCPNCGLKGHNATDCPSWRQDLPRPSVREVIDYRHPPKTNHRPGPWPVGGKISIPFKPPKKNRQNDTNNQNAQFVQGIQGMPSSRRAERRSWPEGNKNQIYNQRYENFNTDRPVNRRKERRRMEKMANRHEILDGGSRSDRPLDFHPTRRNALPIWRYNA